MLKVLVPSLIASGLAALVGAVVGGSITYWTVTENRRANLMLDAYESYLPEAVRALTIAQKEKLAREDILRIGEAGAVLTIYGSEEVQCRAITFERCLMSDLKKAKKKYGELAQTIKAEALGEVRELEKCVWPPQNPAQGECPIHQR